MLGVIAFSPINGRLFFSGNSEFWVTDGTSEGTTMLSGATVVNRPYPTLFQGRLIFGGENDEVGYEPFATDGVEIELVQDIVPETSLGSPPVPPAHSLKTLQSTTGLSTSLDC